MRKLISFRLFSLCVTLFVLIPLLAFAPAQTAPSRKADPDGMPPAPPRGQSAMFGLPDLPLVVELEGPSVAESMVAEQAASAGVLRQMYQSPRVMDFHATRAISYRQRIQAEQSALIRRVNLLGGAEIVGSVDTVLNAVFVRIPLDRYEEVQRLPGVKKVYFSRMYRLALDYAPGVLNAQGMWDRAGGSAHAGAGVRIGVIDTGIDINNPMVQDDSLTVPSGFPKGDTPNTNKKVIVARHYVTTANGYASQPVQSAIDEVGHGTFVSGCAAGHLTAAPSGTIGGMAQGAFLGTYKVFGTPGINDGASSLAIIAAVNDAVSDGMNVLNLSLGALAYVPAAEDAESKALANAIASGVVVALAAGNDGPGNFTISNPGSMPEAITVGAVTNAREFIYQLRATAPTPVPSNLQNLAYAPGSGLSLDTKISAPIVDVSTLGVASSGCATIASGSLTGKVALVSSETCSYLSKAQNAASAGAVALIVYRYASGLGLVTMGGTGASPIPAVMLSNADGTALKTFIATDPTKAAVEIDVAAPVSTTPRILSDFSSRGPSPDFNLKPDLVAVGEHVYSATQKINTSGSMYNTSRYYYGNGTSFSTPMVAGVAAVMKQLYPNFTPQDIKSALTTTANRNVSFEVGGTADLIHSGAGLLDMTKAASVGATFSPSNLSFGVTPYSSGLSLTRSLVIKNVSSTSDSFNITVEPLASGPTIALNRTNTGSIPSGGTTTVDVSVRPSGSMTGAFRGFIAVQSANTSTTYKIPYWSGIFVQDSSRVLTLSSTATGGTGVYRTLDDAIGYAQPGNIIEIADSATYQVASSLSVNYDGLPLHGLTIRAAAGKTPTLTGTGTGYSYNLQIIGLRNVLLQNLKITGGYIGVLIQQPATSVPTSVAIDHCTITGQDDYGDGAGVYISGGNVTITNSTISNGGLFGVYATNRAILTLSKTTVDSNEYSAGLEAHSSSVQILNSTFTNNYGAGATLYYCASTVDGSTFSNNKGNSYYWGDGLEIMSGRATVSNNLVEKNAGRGIFFYPATSGAAAPEGVVFRNIVRSNSMHGILLNPGKNVRIEGNFVKANGPGIRLTGGTTATLLNNVVANSAGTQVANAGNGIAIALSSNVRIINNTIFGNTTGVALESGTSPVYNSILWSNTSDVSGSLTVDNIHNSLVASSTLATGTNITGDPKFTDATSDNFELGTGSPAIDAGDNTVADLPFLDYSQKLRAASSTSRPGEGKVDIGAFEYGSAYPLVFPLLANGQQASLGDNFTTGFAFLNVGTASTDAVFTAYGQAAGLLSGSTNPATRTVAAGAQVPLLGYQLFGYSDSSAQIGSVLAASASKLTGFFLLFDKDFNRFADGVDVSDGAATSMSFMRHLNDSSGHTSYSVFNPGINTANVTATLYNTSGSSVGTPKTSAIVPKGQSVFSFTDTTLSSGYVRVQSDRPVAGMEVFGSSADFSALRAAPTGTDGVVYFPHFAVNSGFSTIIGIVNTTGDASSLVITGYNSDGSRIGAPVTRTLAANGQILESVASLFGLGSGSLYTGYIVVSSDKGGIAGYTGFKYDDGSVQSSAAVPAISVPRTKLIFSHIANDAASGSGTYFTGIALLNPYGVPVQYTMKVFDGTSTTPKAELTATIGAGEKISKYLSHPSAGAGYFTQALALSSGHIEVTSDVGLIGFELFYTPNVSQLASVPAQSSN